MASGNGSAARERYVSVLAGFGLSMAEIRSLHGVESFDRQALYESGRIGRPKTHVSLDALRTRLPELIASSAVGIEAPRTYRNDRPVAQLRSVFERFGGDLEVDPSSDATVIAGETEIRIEDGRHGFVRRTVFEYPETPLTDDNYPALIAAINEEILVDANVEFVRLVDDGEHWRFALINDERLDRLTGRFGDRLTWAGQPLLAEFQPSAYSGSVPRTEITRLFRRRSPPSFEAVAATVDESAEPSSFDHGDRTGPAVDDLVAADDPRAVVESDGARPSTPGRTPGSGTAEYETARTVDRDDTPDEAVLDLFDSIDESTTATPAGERGAEEPATTGPGVDATGRQSHPPPTDAPPADRRTTTDHTLDSVFDRIERNAAGDLGPSPTNEDDGATSSEILETIGHENAGPSTSVAGGFIWLDPEELTPVPNAVYEAVVENS